jgi:hypothetical protein
VLEGNVLAQDCRRLVVNHEFSVAVAVCLVQWQIWPVHPTHPPTLHTDVKNPNPVFAELAAIPITSLIKRIEDAERNRKESEEALSREQERSKELEIRWKALCNKKEKVRLSAALLCIPGAHRKSHGKSSTFCEQK